MSIWRGFSFVFWIILLGQCQGQLKENFYSSTCPNVESIVHQVVSTKVIQTFTTVQATLRLFFHDCLIEVSALIDACDPESQPTVGDFASSPGDFYTAFITGIKKLGRSGVKTGDQGQIRKDCTAFNS
ncbi:hypothetical protein POM88_035892 [Heracleum sosnowskyi]|uniref:peroxidase n=1 Tax=Heracleum sosnowskyi TaxID=360622 RepID=A0AAD8HM59_9APIA|nr:hypothetical protein POM88_035892 [Heracleum sosnowskyi]